MWQIHEGAWPSDAGGKASAATPPGVRIHPDAGRRHRPDPTILPLCSLTHQTGASRSTPRPADVVAQSMPRHQPAGRVPICTRVHRSAHPSVSGRARYTGRLDTVAATNPNAHTNVLALQATLLWLDVRNGQAQQRVVGALRDDPWNRMANSCSKPPRPGFTPLGPLKKARLPDGAGQGGKPPSDRLSTGRALCLAHACRTSPGDSRHAARADVSPCHLLLLALQVVALPRRGLRGQLLHPIVLGLR